MVLKLLLNTRMIWIIFTTILIVFDDIIADMLSNKELDPSVIELFIRKRALKISLVFVTQSYFTGSKNIIQNILHTILLWKYQINERLNKLHLMIHQILNFKTFNNLYKTCPAKPFSFLVVDATFASDNPLWFRNNLLEII